MNSHAYGIAITKFRNWYRQCSFSPAQSTVQPVLPSQACENQQCSSKAWHENQCSDSGVDIHRGIFRKNAWSHVTLIGHLSCLQQNKTCISYQWTHPKHKDGLNSYQLTITYSFIFASCICVIPTTHFVCSSVLLLNKILFLFAPSICLSPSSPILTHPSPPLVLPSAPQKHVLIFCCQPTTVAAVSCFCVQNYCLIWPPFLLTFGQHLLLWKPFSLMKQYTCFASFKVVLPCMLCLYNSKVVIRLWSVTYMMQNGERKKNTWKFCKIIMK